MQTQFANAVTQKENGTRLGGSILRRTASPSSPFAPRP